MGARKAEMGQQEECGPLSKQTPGFCFLAGLCQAIRVLLVVLLHPDFSLFFGNMKTSRLDGVL